MSMSQMTTGPNCSGSHQLDTGLAIMCSPEPTLIDSGTCSRPTFIDRSPQY